MRLLRDEHAPTPVQEFATELVLVARATIHGQAQESCGSARRPSGQLEGLSKVGGDAQD